MKNMIKSIVASVAMTLCASVGLASTETNITFCVGESVEFTCTGTPSVDKDNSTKDYATNVTVTITSGKVTFQGKLDTPSTNTVTIVLKGLNATTRGPEMPTEDRYIFTVKTVEIEKTIQAWNSEAAREVGNPNYDPENKSNSTIRVVTHILKGNITTRPPNVLFLGTRCGAHDLTRDTVVKSINALLSIGNVDYYLFDSFEDGKEASARAKKSGQKLKGGSVTESDIYSSEFPTEGNHSALSGFYNELNAIITDDSMRTREGDVYDYDYIVIETDGTRVAHKYAVAESTEQLAKMKRVAEYLAPFYDEKRVIWVLDNGFDYYYNDLENTSHEKPNHHYFEYATEAGGYSQEIYQYGKVGSGSPAVTNAYRVNNGYIRNSNQANQYFNRLNDLQWKAFLGVFDPSLYLNNVTNGTTQFYVDSKFADVRVSTGTSSYGKNNLELYAGHEYEIQTWYDNAESLGNYLKTIVKPIPFNAVIADNVVQTYGGVDDMGLSLIDGANSVRFYEVNTENWKPGDEAPDTDDTNAWVAVTSGWGVNPETMAVTATVKRIVSEWWNKIEVDIEDDGTFFAKCLATGRYEGPDANGNYLLNPNKDEATIELYDDTGKLLTKRSGAVDPTQQWEFEPRNMLVEYGDTEKTYDGIATNIWLKSGPFDAEYTSSNITKICVFSNSFDGVNWKSEEDFKKDWLVNATPASNVIWKVSALGYNTVQGTNTVTINKRDVVVESGNEDKTYDGVAATNWTAEVTSELDFIDKDKDKVSYKYDGTQTDAGESPNAFNVVFEDPAVAQNYNVTLVTGTLNVARAPILVVADDAEKKYGEDDPDPFSWSLDPDESEIAKGETNKVYVALSNVVELARCSLKGDFEDLEEDVDTYVGVITTNKPFAVYTTGVLKNYDLSFLKGDFEITPDKLIYIPPERDEHTPPEAEIKAGNATPYDYIGIYDGKKHTIRFKVFPTEDDNDKPRVTQVRFSEDGEEWTKWEDYSATGDYKNIPTVKDCDTKVPVYVQAQNEPNYPDITNLVAYVTITQRLVIVTADSDTKTYDGKPLTCKTWEAEEDEGNQRGFVTGEGIASLSMTAASTITDVGTKNNEIDETTVVFNSKTDSDNYIIEYRKGELNVTPLYVTVCPKAGKKCEGDDDPVIGYRVYVGRPGGLGDEITTKMPKAEQGAYKYDDGGTGAVGSYEIVKSVDYAFGGNYVVETVATDKDGKKVKFTIEQCKCMELTCVSVHRVKLSGKACVAKTLAADKKTKATCEDSCWLKPGSFRIAGYFYGASDEELEECESCACQETFVGPYYHFWDASKKQVVFTPAGVAFDILRNGGDKKKAQTCFTLSQEKGVLYCAGFGEMSYKTYAGGLLKGASGFFAGTIDAPKCSSYNEETCEESTATAKAFLPCALTETEPELAIAYGRWNVAYKSEMVKKVEAEGSWDCLYPTGYQEADGN